MNIDVELPDHFWGNDSSEPDASVTMYNLAGETMGCYIVPVSCSWGHVISLFLHEENIDPENWDAWRFHLITLNIAEGPAIISIIFV
eukprot:1849332-Karenia_brevis.AAC.1